MQAVSEISSSLFICLILTCVEPRHIEPRSDVEDGTRVGIPVSKFPHHTSGRAFDPLRMNDLGCNGPPYTTDLLWNRVTNLGPSGLEVETLPLGHRGLYRWLRVARVKKKERNTLYFLFTYPVHEKGRKSTSFKFLNSILPPRARVLPAPT
ncbi:hypothetical protein AVEN_244227-1 [Araneus ventricosus]|uniref:Uncharacterized protein n=1 Tax=Araneus ventricosus TaxID=182803 RepID=A0A4Y2QFB4_ARAVE|nr:hypothetical protein AVEN_244227-1 [Araneus ventricosus]